MGEVIGEGIGAVSPERGARSAGAAKARLSINRDGFSTYRKRPALMAVTTA